MHRLMGLWLLAFGLLVGQSDLATSAFAFDDALKAEAGSGEHSKSGDHAKTDGHAMGAPLDFKSDLAIWSLVTFLVYLFVLKKAAWQPLISGLDQREAGVKQALADAKSARVKAEEMLAEHAKKLDTVQEEVKEILAEARRDAEYTKQEIVAAANKEAEATRKRAVEEIEHARDVAIKDLFDFVSANVIGATENVLGRALSDDDQKRLVQDALSQIGSKT